MNKTRSFYCLQVGNYILCRHAKGTNPIYVVFEVLKLGRGIYSKVVLSNIDGYKIGQKDEGFPNYKDWDTRNRTWEYYILESLEEAKLILLVT